MQDNAGHAVAETEPGLSPEPIPAVVAMGQRRGGEVA
jgi:hypothetical protein